MYGKKESGIMFLKLRKKDDKFGFFHFKKMESGEWESNDFFDFVEGNIVSMKLDGFTTKKGFQDTLKITVNDENEKGEIETVQIEMNFNNVTRSLLNTFFYAGINNVQLKGARVVLESYTGKDEYPKLKVRLNGDKIDWAFPLDEIPKTEVIKDKKGNVLTVDDGEANEFFVEKFNEILKPLFA